MGLKGWNVAVLVAIGAIWFAGSTQREKRVVGDTHTDRVALLEEQAIQILQFDCTMMGGFTEGRKLAALCELNSVQVAPHHDCFLHAHIVAASPAGALVSAVVVTVAA